MALFIGLRRSARLLLRVVVGGFRLVVQGYFGTERVYPCGMVLGLFDHFEFREIYVVEIIGKLQHSLPEAG
jgi:hypothetical protein